MILPDTTLCAIVRDEAMNPAGGIVDFVDSTVPFVEEAVIVDTGSVDGTREMLEQLESEYHNLTVVDATFIDYASARNVSLKYAKTKRALVLDADERLTRKDFRDLKKIVERENFIGYNFQIANVYPNEERGMGGLHNPRLFTIEPRNRRYTGRAYYCNTNGKKGEWLYIDSAPSRDKTKTIVRMDSFEYSDHIDIAVKHFFASLSGAHNKWEYWYSRVIDNRKLLRVPPPSQQLRFDSWKQYNPRRELYR